MLVARDTGYGLATIGWRISADKHFNYRRLTKFFNSLAVKRKKVGAITDADIFAYNLSSGVLKEITIGDCRVPRIEIICQKTASNGAATLWRVLPLHN